MFAPTILPMLQPLPQVQRRSPARCLGLLLAAAVGGCSLNVPPAARPAAVSQAMVTTPDLAVIPSAEQAPAAAHAAEAEAALARGATRTDLLIRATRLWLVAGDGGSAARVFAQLGPVQPPELRRTLLGVEVALAQGQPGKASTLLDHWPSTTPPNTEIAAARARIAFARGAISEAVRWSVEADAAGRRAGSATPSSRLWTQLRAATQRGASLSSPAGATEPVVGWLDLARTAAQADHNPGQRPLLLREWRQRHPEHPANGPLVISMIEASPPALPPSGRLALLVPLSGRAQTAGVAVRDGFLAAFYAQPPAARPRVRVYDTGTDALAAYQRALAEGAEAVVGPLTKEEAVALARSSEVRVPTLALNFLPAGVAPPAKFYQYSLAPEDEAVQVARRLIAEGRRHGVALLPAGEWGQRVLQAFEATLTGGGGRLIAKRVYATDTSDFTDPILALLGVDEAKARHHKLTQVLGEPLEFNARRRSNIEFVFIAGQPQAARLIRPQLRFHFAGDLPVYATSEIYDPNPKANLDLEGVMFPDMPWMIDPDPTMPDVRNDLRQAWPDRLRRRGRLYALGFDAYAVLTEIRVAREPFRSPLAGMTGRLTVDTARRIHRDLEWLQLRGGEPRVLPPISLAEPGQP